MPRLIQPMMARPRPGLPRDDDRYGWEFKWDGVRAVAYVRGGQLRLLSRTGREMTGHYPELAVLVRRVRLPVILDGEIIAIRDGRPDFGALQSRMHVGNPPVRLVRDTPVQLYLFDLLHYDGESLLRVPYTGRRQRLEELGLAEDPVRTTPWYTQAMLTDLARRLGPLRCPSSPFGIAVPAEHARDARWVEPRLAGEVAFTEWTTDMILRHPSWRGLRTDNNADQARRDT